MNEKSQVWFEKYRPKVLNDIVGQDRTIKRLISYVKSGEFPNLMFSGAPGTGKTTGAIAFAKEIFGEYFGDNFTELNTSDERGIEVVRKKIVNIATSTPSGDFDFRILFLDECDALTSDAQSALRRTMEKWSFNCKFILSCNYSSKIIEPIQSRVAIYRFGKLDDSAVIEMLNKIIKSEQLKLDKTAMEAILYVADGDMRKAINTLQASSLKGIVTGEEIYEVAGYVHPVFVEEMIELVLKGNFIKSRIKMNELLINEGMSGIDVIYQVHKKLMDMSIPGKTLTELISSVGEIDYRLTEGANERIQLDCLLSWFEKIGSDFK